MLKLQMNKYKILFLLFGTLFSQLMSQTATADHTKKRLSVDNMQLLLHDSVGFSHVPRILGDCYYSKTCGEVVQDLSGINGEVVKDITIENYGLQYIPLALIYTKSAKSGYLYVNSVISDSLKETGSVCDSVRYFVNDIEIANCKSVVKFLKMRRKSVKKVTLSNQEDFLRVDVYSK